jgi:hypothetical protein
LEVSICNHAYLIFRLFVCCVITTSAVPVPSDLSGTRH